MQFKARISKDKIVGLIRREIVLVIAIVLALFSCLLVPPDIKYIKYIDMRTIILLFSLMVVMSGLREVGLFPYVGNKLLENVKTRRGLIYILVFICFFSSMLITNDVALIMFVPFAILVLKKANMGDEICSVVVFMTIAANLGSMLTPVGNPQNLYLYNISGISLRIFIETMLPYTLISGILLVISIFLSHRKKEVIGSQELEKVKMSGKRLFYYLTIFSICILAVIRVINIELLIGIVFISTLIKNRKLFLKVDYSLLLTFLAFFIFVGNLGRLSFVRTTIEHLLYGSEKYVAIAVSQFISNVPATLLLSDFTHDYKSLMIGSNIGGLGTLIASMASLISYKLVVAECPNLKGRYFKIFTFWNIVFLLVFLIILK